MVQRALVERSGPLDALWIMFGPGTGCVCRHEFLPAAPRAASSGSVATYANVGRRTFTLLYCQKLPFGDDSSAQDEKPNAA